MLTNSQFREQRVDLVAIDIEPKSKRVSIELIKNIDNIWWIYLFMLHYKNEKNCLKNN